MKVYSKNIKGSEVEKIEIKATLGIEIVHNSKVYTVSITNGGALTLRAISDLQLLIRPSASNAVEVSSE